MKSLSHFDDSGAVRMVNVSDKEPTYRTARAHAFVKLSPEVIRKLPDNPKGNPLEVARIAGISGAKRTSELIPLCHPLMLTNVDVRIDLADNGAEIHTEVATTAATGVEMEALTAASIAALTIYDMTKALDKSIEISDVYLVEKKGGKSGSYRRSQTTA
jgi:cyclic pyranopterin phosphate synthase